MNFTNINITKMETNSRKLNHNSWRVVQKYEKGVSYQENSYFL